MYDTLKKGIAIGAAGLAGLVSNAYSGDKDMTPLQRVNKAQEQTEETIDAYQTIIDKGEKIKGYIKDSETKKDDKMLPRLNENLDGIKNALELEKTNYNNLQSMEKVIKAGNEFEKITDKLSKSVTDLENNLDDSPLQIAPERDNSGYNGNRIGNDQLDDFLGE